VWLLTGSVGNQFSLHLISCRVDLRSTSTNGLSCRTPIRYPKNQEAVFVPVLCRPKNGYPQERVPLAFRVPTMVGISSTDTWSRERQELAHSGAQTACRSYPRSCTRLGSETMGFKTQKQKVKLNPGIKHRVNVRNESTLQTNRPLIK